MGAGMDEPVPPREAKEVKEREISVTVAAVRHGTVSNPSDTCVLVVPDASSDVTNLPDTGEYKLYIAKSPTREFELCEHGLTGLKVEAGGAPYDYYRSRRAIDYAQPGDKLNIRLAEPSFFRYEKVGIENLTLRERLEQIKSGEKEKK